MNVFRRMEVLDNFILQNLYQMPYLFILIASLFSSLTLGDTHGFRYVTCGSVVKLLNPTHNIRLHSHEVKYGSGSGQQSVTGVDSPDDANSYWVLKSKADASCKRGTPIKCGSTIRLQHLATKRNLHSHYFQSPISQNQEVSAFGDDNGVGDEGDNWSVICNTKHWERKAVVRFKHSATKVYMHTTGEQFGRPIQGQREISGYKTIDPGNEWKAMEGIYLKPDEK